MIPTPTTFQERFSTHERFDTEPFNPFKENFIKDVTILEKDYNVPFEIKEE